MQGPAYLHLLAGVQYMRLRVWCLRVAGFRHWPACNSRTPERPQKRSLRPACCCVARALSWQRGRGAAPLPGPGWPLLRPPKPQAPIPQHSFAVHLLGAWKGESAKKVRDQRQLPPTHPTSASSPSTHCQTCVVPSHRRHVCRTASEPEGRVEGTPSRESGPPTGGLLLTAAVC